MLASFVIFHGRRAAATSSRRTRGAGHSSAAAKTQRRLTNHFAQQLLLGLAFAQPAGVVAVVLHRLAQRGQGVGGLALLGEGQQLVHGGQQVIAQWQVLAARGIDVDRVQPEAAGLEAVVAVDQVVVLGRPRPEVYREWLGRIGERANLLAGPQESFKQAIAARVKKPPNK